MFIEPLNDKNQFVVFTVMLPYYTCVKDFKDQYLKNTFIKFTRTQVNLYCNETRFNLNLRKY